MQFFNPKMMSHVVHRCHGRLGGSLTRLKDFDDPRLGLSDDEALVVNLTDVHSYLGSVIFPKQVRRFLFEKRTQAWMKDERAFIWTIYEEDKSVIGFGVVASKVRIAELLSKEPQQYEELIGASR